MDEFFWNIAVSFIANVVIPQEDQLPINNSDLSINWPETLLEKIAVKDNTIIILSILFYLFTIYQNIEVQIITHNGGGLCAVRALALVSCHTIQNLL